MIARGGSQEAWRWRADSYYTPHHTISVIEPPANEDDRRERNVPFGFARALEPRAEAESLLWDGDQA